MAVSQDCQTTESIDAAALSLEQWLDLLKITRGSVSFIDYEFPTQEHKEEYLSSIDSRDEQEVIALIKRFLIPSGTLGHDELALRWLIATKADAPEIHRRLLQSEYYRRLIVWKLSKGKAPPPWEGLTWILDLLPPFPREAIAAVDAYVLAHAQELPDGRYRGLLEVAELIRAKFIGTPKAASQKLTFLQGIDPFHLECIVERLFAAMGYDTRLTGRRADGGYDIIASRNLLGQREHVRIECKRHKSRVGRPILDAVLGIVSASKVSRGIVVTTSEFTGPARRFASENPRLELVDGGQVVVLLNEHLGPTWPARIDSLILESRRRSSSTLIRSTQ